jgi:hypothetical protein
VTPIPDASDVLRELNAQFRRRGPSPEAAMIAVTPFLEARDEEIARLRRQLAEENDETS